MSQTDARRDEKDVATSNRRRNRERRWWAAKGRHNHYVDRLKRQTPMMDLWH